MLFDLLAEVGGTNVENNYKEGEKDEEKFGTVFTSGRDCMRYH